MKVAIQTVFSPLISTLLYVAIFGLPMQTAFKEVHGVPYLAFLVPGLIMMGVINNAFQNPSSSLMIAKYNNTINEILMLPLSAMEKVVAYVGGGMFRGLLVGFVIWICVLPFVHLPLAHPFLVILVALLVSAIFSAFGIIAGVWARDFDQMAVLNNFLLTPAIFLGGVFYSIHNLPGWVSKVSLFNPIFYMIDGLRFGFIGQSDVSPVLSLGVLFALLLVNVFFSWRVFVTGWRLQQ